MKQIPLSKGGYTLVDDDVYGWLSKFKWHKSKLGYAVCKTPKKNIEALGLPYITRMHVVIAGTPKGLTTDHINGDKLDNRRSNLRICTRQQNLLNRKRTNRSGFKGVSGVPQRPGYWRARIKDRTIGVYKTKEQAALAYNQAAASEFGDYAWLN